MNCDGVFDILTRGPFPSGDDHDDASVERHLRACHDCRQLAEALRPAVDLFHESVEAEEGRDLPGYRGALLSPPVDKLSRTVQTAIAQAAPQRPQLDHWWPAQRLTQAGIGRYVAATLLAASLGMLLWALMGIDDNSSAWHRPPQVTPPQRIVAARYQPDSQGRITLAALKLSKDCLHSQRDASNSTQDSAMLCCTQCHSTANANRPPLSTVAIAKLDRSCRACHHSNR